MDTLATGLEVPYGIEILDEEEYLMTDRAGKLFRFSAGELQEISGMPTVKNFTDPGIPLILHGGLMDITVHPGYPAVSWIYVSYLGTDDKARVSRVKLQGNQAVDMETIFETSSGILFGNNARMTWQDSSHFFLNIGGSALSTVSNPILTSQDLNESWGKIHRLNDDGSIPADNPIFPGFTEPLSIWSFGHRDATGLWYEQSSETLFALEHGPKGGDEFNIVEKGNNYGWPLFTYGIDYSGVQVSTISERDASQITVLPEYFWTVETNDGGQAIAPSFLLRADGSNVSDWNGQFLLGSLHYRRVFLFDRNSKTTTALPITGRVRNMVQLPSGDFIALIERTKVGETNGVLVRISRA